MGPPEIWLSGVTIDCADPLRVATFWATLLGGELRVPLEGWFRLGPLTPDGPALNFQPVPERKRDKVRIHPDLRTEDADGALAAVQLAGGRSLDRHDYDEGTVRVLADPEGNEFCITQYYAPPG